MYKYPFDKYKFIVLEDKRKVIAITNDAGKVVKGVAVCSAEDNFDIEFGKKLAAARANYKVAVRRKKRAISHLDEANELLDLAFANRADVLDFYEDASQQLLNAENELKNLNN